ncbi:aldehyde dehydrogenase family protein [Streptomyces sp. NPDC058239]|uniref:aldehyde dehydrogenase family protein n=1 Tax=unclassified Streptomyces TaxID=2593676 RepID=UPI00364867E4
MRNEQQEATTNTELTDPRTGRSRGTAPVSRKPEVAVTVAAARTALGTWSALTPRDRARRLDRLATLIEVSAAQYAARERACRHALRQVVAARTGCGAHVA